MQNILPIRKTKRVYILAIVAIFFIVNTLLCLYLLKSKSTSVKQEKNALRVIILLENIDKTVTNAETGQRGFILTQDASYLKPYSISSKKIKVLMDELKEKESSLIDISNQAHELEKLLNSKWQELEKTISLVKDNQRKEAIELVKSDIGYELMQKIKKNLSVVREQQLNIIKNIQESSNNSNWVAFYLVIFSNTIGFTLIFFYLYSIKNAFRREQSLMGSLVQANDSLEKNVKNRTLELTEKSDALERSNRELEEFAYVASHDLQEPLRKIRAFGDRLEAHCKDVFDEKGLDYLSRMQNASKRMSILIEDLLAFSRVTTTDIEHTNIELTALVEGVVLDIKNSHPNDIANISVDTLPTVSGDYLQLQRVFTNLISNSIKYKHDSNPLDITISSSRIKADDINHIIENPIVAFYCKVECRDNGIGMDMKFSEKIFVMFQRLHSRSKYEGTGIGLAICKKIIERHLGAIVVDRSSPGQGTTIAIYFPEVIEKI